MREDGQLMGAAGLGVQQLIFPRDAGGHDRAAASPTAIAPMVLISGLAPGGAERVVVSLACRLAERGRAPVVCTITTEGDDAQLAGELCAAHVPRHDLGARRLSDPMAAVRYLRMLARARIDVVHAHGQDAWILAASLRSVARVPLVFTRHVMEEPSGTWRQSLRRRAALAAARHADALVAPSSATAERLAQIAGVQVSRIRVIHNGVDLERFSPAAGAASRGAIRRALGLAADDLAVLMPAVLRPGKGHEVLLDALPMIMSELPRVRLLFAGAGEREDELRARAAPLGAAVAFLGHRRDLPELLAASDLVVLPSFSEALPTALIESAAAGRPVVATRVGGTPDVVQHGVTGLLVPPGDVPALAAAVVSVLRDPSKADSFGRAGRVVARWRFSLDGNVDRTLELWSRIVAAGRQKP